MTEFDKATIEAAGKAANEAARRFKHFNDPAKLREVFGKDGELEAGMTFDGFTRVITATEPFSCTDGTARLVMMQDPDLNFTVGTIVRENHGQEPKIVYQETRYFPQGGIDDAHALFDQFATVLKEANGQKAVINL